MYVYDSVDQQIVDDRVAQFRDQTRRYLAGELSEQAFLPLRLQNGLYIQRVAPMLRVAVPYGLLSSRQLRKLAAISRDYDKGYAHVSTRQNFQFNWPRLEEVPDLLAELASVQMHAIQTSGNCIRNTTTDQYAGVAPDEIEDPRPWCELIRQWSTLHPEFAFLPRKFKIAVCGSLEDRAAIYNHDIGVDIVKNDAGEPAFNIIVGGGLGRTPVIGALIKENLAPKHLLTYLDAILRVYNRLGRRDNKYKARIKILLKAMGAEAFAEAVDEAWQPIKDGVNTLTEEAIARTKTFFTEPDYAVLDPLEAQQLLNETLSENTEFARWYQYNTRAHRVAGYRIVDVPLKAPGSAPGDISDWQMDVVADLAERYSFAEIRTTHEQNMVLADVRISDVYALWQALANAGLATANMGTLTDMICCPGGDFCSLANAKSLPVADALHAKFDDLDYLYDLGPIDLNISGCMNACGHHHIGHIGILGVDKKGEEFFQVSLGGSQGKNPSLGKILGPAFKAEDVPEVIGTLLETYVELREGQESFLATYQRLGMPAFKERVYARAA